MHVGSFEDRAIKLMGEAKLLECIVFLAENADSEPPLSGTGGFRKIRFARENQGKSGGFRIIYMMTDCYIYPVMIFAKNERSNITQAQANALRTVSKTFT